MYILDIDMQLVLLEPSLPFVVNYRPSLNSLDIINDDEI